MMQQWHEIQLGDIVKIKHGWPFKSEYCSENLTGKPVVVSIGNFRYTGGFRFDSTDKREYTAEYPHEYNLEPGSILLVMTCQTEGGEILGIPGRIPDDGRLYLHNQRMGKVIVTRPDLVDDGFLYWLFLWHEFNSELVASASGTKIVHTSPGRIEAFRFALPPLDEQRAIARVLRALDDKIEHNRRMNRTLEQAAETLFTSWFVNFDPVVAKAEGRQPCAMPPEVAALFPDRFVESPVGPVPAGWTVSTIGEEVKVVGGSTPSTSEPAFWEGDIHWITPRDLSKLNDPIVLSTERTITKAGLAKISSGLLPVGTILLSSRAPIGYLAYAEIPVAINQGFIAMRCQGRLSKHYVFQWVKENMEEILTRAGGTTFAEISKANFRPIPAIVPGHDVITAFDAIIEPLHQRLVANAKNNLKLATMRDLLLPQLLSGDLRLPEVERQLAEVL